MIFDAVRSRRAPRAARGMGGVAALFGAGVLFAWPAQAGPSFTGLGDLAGGEYKSSVSRISADGTTVVGYSVTADGEEPFRWTWSGGMQGLGVIPREPNTALNSNAIGVSADGSIVVGYSHTRGFSWTEAGGLVDISDLGGGLLLDFPRDAADDGTTLVGRVDVGTSYVYARVADGGPVEVIENTHPSGGNLTVSSISGDGNVVVGTHRTPVDPLIDPGRMFRWSADEGTVYSQSLPGGLYLPRTRDVSYDGTTVVGYAWNGSSDHALVWREGGDPVQLDGPNGFPVISAAHGVSADGSVIVGNAAFAGSPGLTAFVWDEAHGMRQLETLLAALGVDTTGWDLVLATTVSADGRTIAGYGYNPSGDVEGWVAIIPEPGTALLVGVGLLALGRGRGAHV